MEVTGIEGNYRRTCHDVMKVLRFNKDSLMAVLEAFVYDPLLNWRLIDTQKEKRSKTRSDSYSAQTDDLLELERYEVNREKPHRKSAGNMKSGQNQEQTVEDEASIGKPEAVNKRALQIVTRVKDKLTGRDFQKDEPVEVEEQVELLIQQATSHANLCQAYIGWCPFW
jgi:FKBP12-rapamycin complex-associated protein